MKNIIFLILLILFYSCESDPVKTSMYNGIEFEQHIFKLDNVLESYQSEANLINTSLSEVLISGLITDSFQDNSIDTVRALVSIDLTKFFEYEYEICTSVVSLEIPTVSLFSNGDLSDVVNSNDLKIKLLPLTYDYIKEDSLHWEEYGVHSLNHLGKCDENINECDILEYSVSEDSNNELIINLSNALLNENSTSILCENSYINLVIEYIPNESSDIQYIEWYSSDFSNQYSFTPKFNLDYVKIESVDTTEYQFTLEEISNTSQNHYFINNHLSEYWSTIYFANINDSIAGAIDSLIDFNDIVINEPIISTEDVSTKIDLGILKIKLNDNPLAQDSISNIFLALENIRAYIDSDDPSGDNYNGSDTLLTDGNTQYDILYNSIGEIISREKFNDFGLDNCENKYEDGNQGCCDNNEECVFNDQGTQNNGILNWVDNDNNGLWSIEDSGEYWQDIGLDGCSDQHEVGTSDIPECSDSLNPNYIDGMDPHGDNYNIDPSGDDYLLNPSGLEGNGILDWNDENNNQIWDDGEEGELWLDYGLDGIPDTNDLGENNNEFDLNFEYFFDYGLDNIPSEEEGGYCGVKSVCSENNGQYDVGELKIEHDVGEDGCSDEYEIGTFDNPVCSDSLNPDYIGGVDPHGDNYNVDPNGDNYNFSQDSGTEYNGSLDWNDENNNQIWDDMEGEQWFDYGLDQTEDIYEQYLSENQIIVSTSANSYEIDIDNFNNYYEAGIPEFGENQVSLWISSIIYNQEEEVYELTISIYSERTLNGIKFNLGHPNPGSNLEVSWSENYERHYVQNVSWHDYEDESGNIVYEKMFEDFSIYSIPNLSSYSETLSDSLAMMNYGYDILCRIDSNEFKTFLDNYSSGIVSRMHSKIIIPVDTTLSTLSNLEFKVDLGLVSDISEIEYSSSSIYGSDLNLSYGFGLVDESKSNLEIKIGDLIQYHINEDIPFEGFIIKNNSESNNLKSLYLKKHNAYIYMVIEK